MSKKKKMTKTQVKRASFNYRKAYFKKYPGLFHCIWFCSQCHKPIFGKSNVQVDHIWALNAGGINRVINTVAICPKCNRKKSDKTGFYLIHGEISKVIEVAMFTIQDIIIALAKILLYPLTSKCSFPIRIIVLIFYITIIFMFVHR